MLFASTRNRHPKPRNETGEFKLGVLFEKLDQRGRRKYVRPGGDATTQPCWCDSSLPIRDGRQPVELEPDDVKFSVDSSRIYPQHVKHVNPKFPGIIAHVFYPEPDGNVLHGHVLIDGHHRAARCLELDRPYYVYLLSEQESRDVLLDGPDVEAILANQKSQI